MERAREAFAHAARDAERDSDADGLAKAALGFAGPTFQSYGEVDGTAIELLERALERLPERDGMLRAQLLARLAMALYFADDAQQLAALSGEAVTMARRLGDRSVIAETLESRLWACWAPDADRLREGITVASELIVMGEDMGRADLLTFARRWRIGALLQLGRVDEARNDIHEHARLAERLNQTYERM